MRWLIGADQVARLPQWHRAAELVQLVSFAIAARPGFTFDFDALPSPFCDLRHNVVEAPLIAISATEIRERVREGKSIRYLVPPGVEDYISRNGLYK